MIYARDHADFPETWAIDYHRNYYIFNAPIIVRPDEMGSTMFFYFNGFLFEMHIKSPFENKITCTDEPNISIFREYQEETAAALAVFDHGCQGPLNQSGIPEFSITPDFKLEG